MKKKKPKPKKMDWTEYCFAEVDDDGTRCAGNE